MPSSPDPPNGTDLDGPDDSFVAHSNPRERIPHQFGRVALDKAETHLVRGHRDARHRRHRAFPCRRAEPREQLRGAFSCGRRGIALDEKERLPHTRGDYKG